MAEPTALPLPLQGFVQLPPRQKIAALAVLAAAIGLITGAWLWARSPSYAVLFSNLSDRDGGAIVAALQQQNVPYRYSEGGGAILVPAEQVHDARLRLASQGLPKGGAVGFELMDTQKLGISQFQEQLNYQRGLEGELARSIQSLSAVQGARVHLAIPKSTGFLRDEQQPSASVLVNLRAGRTLEAQQVAGIVHLVAASVPHLAPGAVSVIDQNGNLVSSAADPLRGAGLDPAQLKYVQEIERSYVKRIEDILTPITGAANLRARVSADVDFALNEQTAESYRPNQDSAQSAVRSQQTSETNSRDAAPAGVPGALTNQPPVPATAPITTPAAATGAAAASVASTLAGRRDATINYEVDKTVRHTRQAGGTVKRLSVAVVVNHRKITGADGKTVTRPFSDAELKQTQDLVKEAMGYNKERGDTLSVANSPFNVADKEMVPETPLWENPRVIELAKDAGRLLLFGAVALWLALAFVRPMLRSLAERAAAPPQEPGAGAHAGALGLAADGTAPGYDQKLQGARELARQNPRLVASVIKDWAGGNER